MCLSSTLTVSHQQQHQQQEFSSQLWRRLLCLVTPSTLFILCPPMASSIQDSQQHSDNANATFAQQADIVTKFRRPTTKTVVKRSRTRRRMGPKLCNSSGAIVTLFTLLTLSSMALPVTHSATFFYGATEESDNDGVMNGENAQFDGARALAMAENAAVHATNNNMDEEEARLSKQELQAVYNFCEILPQLQEQGFIPENKHARDICKKLVDMLKPMFRKRARAAHLSLPIPSRPRRHVAALLLRQRKR